MVEDESALLKNRREADIHLDTIKKKSNPGESTKLDFGDIFNQLENQSDVVNTTKLKKQLKNMSKDGSKTLGAPLSGYKKVKIMRE